MAVCGTCTREHESDVSCVDAGGQALRDIAFDRQPSRPHWDPTPERRQERLTFVACVAVVAAAWFLLYFVPGG